MTAVEVSPERVIEEFLGEIERPARLLVAISGGSDSTGLLIALWQAAKAIDGIEIFAVTVDHGLRPEAAGEAEAVARLCREHGIVHFIRTWEGDKPASGISAAAREARYRLLLALAQEVGATAILTGHTLDDQIETVTMRHARSDRDDNLGLAGMAPAALVDRSIWLLRPFLATRRADIRAFLARQAIGWIDDPSNLDTHYERVRTRKALAADAPSDVVLAGIIGAAERRLRLSEAAADLARRYLTIRHAALAHLAPEALVADPAVLRHLIAMLAAVVGGRAHGPKSVSMDKVMAVLSSAMPGRITAGRVIFERRREGVYMLRENRGLVQLDVEAGDTIVWDGRYRIHNGASGAVTVGPLPSERVQASRLFADMPPTVAMRAMAGLPHLRNVAENGEDRPAQAGEMAVAITPVLAPFDRFLPQFDLTLATEFAVLLGCDVFPRLPIKVSVRKS